MRALNGRIPMSGLISDRESLVAALREQSVDWLAPSDAIGGEDIAPAMLVASLAAHGDPRLRSALTGLFLLRPQLSAALPGAIEMLDLSQRDELMARYTAAVYLQHLWRTRLGLYTGDFLELPDLYSASLDLPPPDEGFGKPGLYALAEWHQQLGCGAFNRLGEYNTVFEQVMASLKIREAAHDPAVAS